MQALGTSASIDSIPPATDGGRPLHVPNAIWAPAAGGLEATPNLTSPPQPCSVEGGGGATLLPRPDPALTRSSSSASDQGGQPAREARPGGAAGGRHEAASWPSDRPDGAVLGVVGASSVGAGPARAGAVRFVRVRSDEGRRYAGYVLRVGADQDALTARLRVERALWSGRA